MLFQHYLFILGNYSFPDTPLDVESNLTLYGWGNAEDVGPISIVSGFVFEGDQ